MAGEHALGGSRSSNQARAGRRCQTLFWGPSPRAHTPVAHATQKAQISLQGNEPDRVQTAEQVVNVAQQLRRRTCVERAWSAQWQGGIEELDLDLTACSCPCCALLRFSACCHRSYLCLMLQPGVRHAAPQPGPAHRLPPAHRRTQPHPHPLRRPPAVHRRPPLPPPRRLHRPPRLGAAPRAVRVERGAPGPALFYQQPWPARPRACLRPSPCGAYRGGARSRHGLPLHYGWHPGCGRRPGLELCHPLCSVD